MYDIYLNCQEKKKKERKRERVQNSHERNTHTLDKKNLLRLYTKKENQTKG
jgi:hypothetical protein